MNFFLNIIRNLLGDSPESQTRRYVSANMKILSSTTPKVFTGKEETLALPFINDLFEIFQPFAVAAKLLKNEYMVKKGVSLKRFLVDEITNEEQLELLSSLSEDKLDAHISTMNRDEFYLHVENIITRYIELFKSEDKSRASKIYNTLHIFAYLGEIDYYAFFKEFDKAFKEDDSSYQPTFQEKEARPFVDDFKLMHKIFISLDFDDALLADIELFLKFRSTSLDIKKAKNSFKLINNLKKRNILETIVRTLMQDKDYTEVPLAFNDLIVNNVLEKIVEEVRGSIDTIFERMKNSHMTNLRSKLFGEETVTPLKGYVSGRNSYFVENGVIPFKYTEELMLVKYWLVLKYNAGVHKLINIFIIKGEWNNEDIKRIMNDTYYILGEYLAKIQAFDIDLSETGDTGRKINRAILTVKKELKNMGSVNEQIDKINVKAGTLIRDFIVAVKMLMMGFEAIDKSYKEGNKKVLNNIKTFDGSKGSVHFAQLPIITNEIILLLNIFKSESLSA